MGEAMSYVQCYRCSVCQKLFSVFSGNMATVLPNEDEVSNALFNMAIGARTVPSQAHYCDDGNIGLALLAGFVRKLNEDDER